MIKWYGEELCNAGFLINLKHREDRYNRARKNLKLAKLTGVKRFDAVVVSDPNFIKYGCTQSHIEIAKKQIKNNWPYVLYLEDDIVTDFFYDYQTNNSKIDKKQLVKNIIKDFKEQKPDVLWLGVRPEGETKRVSDTSVSAGKTLMSHAYVGSIKYAKFLVEFLKYRENNFFSKNWPIDYFISQIGTKDAWELDVFPNEQFKNNDLKVQIVSPMIFTQGNSFSDLTDNYVNYEIWVQGSYNAYVNATNLKIKKFLYE
jgi:GR25 family glycosyltransferase involved in LPS biosynthesis